AQKELADDVHAHGAAVMIQVTHLGRRTSWSKADWLPVIAPSYVREPAHRAFPKVMEDRDIARVAEADAYGGPLENRMRFALEVLAAIRKRVGDDLLVGIRMVCDEDWDRGLSREEGVSIARRLAASGLVDFVNVIRGHIETDEALSHVIP